MAVLGWRPWFPTDRRDQCARRAGTGPRGERAGRAWSQVMWGSGVVRLLDPVPQVW